jgi:heptosyltransferase-2
MNFAVIRLSSFGDIVLTEPVTRSIKARYPDARLYYITRAEFARLPALFEAVDEVMPYSKDGPNEEIGKLASAIAFEGVIDLQNNLRSRRVSKSLRARRRARYRRQLLRRFVLVKMPWLWKGNLRHTVDLYGDALRRLGISLVDRWPSVEPGAKAEAEARALLEKAGTHGGSVAVCPGGSSEFKRWPEASFAELVVALAAYGERVVLVGSEMDRPQVEAVAALSAGANPAVVISDDPALLAAVLSLEVVTVSNDSGLMHLAAAVGSSVVALFGPTSPALGFAPQGGRHELLSLGLDCSPCSYHGNRPCRLKRRVCMEEITPAEVKRVVHILTGDDMYE